MTLETVFATRGNASPLPKGRSRSRLAAVALLGLLLPAALAMAGVDPVPSKVDAGHEHQMPNGIVAANGGHAQAVIVVGEAAGEGAKFAATELRKSLQALSGAQFEIATAGQNVSQSPSQALILIGGPDQNSLVKRAAAASLARFSGLKPEGFVLKTLRFDKRPVVVAGGNTDAGTMYAVFELAARLGATFRLTGDTLPPPRSSLEVPPLNLRLEPAIDQRGFLMEASHHPSITMLGYDDYSRLIDQMAKIKDNYLMIWWFAYSPFLKFSYRGETKMMGDMATKASSFLNSIYAGGGSQTTDDVTIGKHWYPGPRLVPPEMQNVETPDDAYAAAQSLMQRRTNPCRGVMPPATIP